MNVVVFGDHTLSLYKPEHPFFVSTDGVRIIKGKQEINGHYLLSLLEKYKPQNEGYKRYYSIISNADCVTTNNKNEQSQIGILFQNINSTIKSYQTKLEMLKIYKKALLDNMFPKYGENVPKIRFEGFTDDWEQCELKNLCSVFTDGDWIESRDQSESGVRLIQTGNIGVTEYLDKPNNRKWVSNATFDRLHCTEVISGDILISRLPDPAGRACIVPNIDQKMITSVDCTIARITPEYYPEYIVQYLSTQDYFNKINNCLAGGTRLRISRGNLSNILIPLPHSNAEQEQIGRFFNHFDHLITIHQQKLDMLKNIKNALLQKMFA